jgi:hypothetical protein
METETGNRLAPSPSQPWSSAAGAWFLWVRGRGFDLPLLLASASH